MARGWVHTVHREGSWMNEIEGEGALSMHRTKDERGCRAGNGACTRTEHVIDNLDGTIAEGNSYGNDLISAAGLAG